MQTIKFYLILLLVTLLHINLYANNDYVNNMLILNQDEDSDVAEIQIKGNGESCQLSFGSNAVIYDTSCLKLTNTKGLNIYCTSQKKICKTYDEIYTFVFEPQPLIKNTPIKTSTSKDITWQDLGIGIDNPGEITDWTYYGIKTPQEASKWIEALKPLGNISYAVVARIWKQDGYSLTDVKDWIHAGVGYPDTVRRWEQSGISSPKEVLKWQKLGIDTPIKVGTWKSSGIETPEDVQKWKSIGVENTYVINEWNAVGADTLAKVEAWKNKGIQSPQALKKYKREVLRKAEEEKEKKLIASFEKGNSHSSTTNTTYVQNSMNKSSVHSTTNKRNKQIVYQEYNNTSKENSGLWNVFLLVYFIIMIITMFKGAGKNRTIIVFRDYNDLGLTFLIPAGAYLMFFLFASFGGNPKFGMILAMTVVLVLFGILIKNSYEDNEKSLLYTLMAVLTKVPLGILWVLNFFTMLNPGGKNAKERRKNRGSAMILLAILTPLISILVVNKEGSYFNPKEWIKGRRVGSLRNHL